MSENGSNGIETKDTVCKYYQTGFCKFRDNCSKKHENETCGDQINCSKQNYTKRHPKVCKNYNTSRKCRFKEDCVYLHVDKEDLTNQNGINEQLTKIMTKYENEIVLINAKMDKLKEIILDMGEQIKSLQIELPDFNKININAAIQNDDVQIIEKSNKYKEPVKLVI